MTLILHKWNSLCTCSFCIIQYSKTWVTIFPGKKKIAASWLELFRRLKQWNAVCHYLCIHCLLNLSSNMQSMIFKKLHFVEWMNTFTFGSEKSLTDVSLVYFVYGNTYYTTDWFLNPLTALTYIQQSHLFRNNIL